MPLRWYAGHGRKVRETTPTGYEVAGTDDDEQLALLLEGVTHLPNLTAGIIGDGISVFP